MREVKNITVAMMKNPEGSSWLAQLHVEFEGTKSKDVLRLNGDTPMQIIERARNAIDKRYKFKDGCLVLSE